MTKRSALMITIIMISSIAFADHHYRLDVELDDFKHEIFGTATVDYHNTSGRPLAEVYFRLPANLGRKPNPKLAKLWNDGGYLKGFEPSWTEIEQVTTGAGIPLVFDYEDALPVFQEYSLEQGFVKVTLGEALAPGAKTTMVLHFRTKVPRRLGDEGYSDGVYVWRFGWYPLIREMVDGKWDGGTRDPVATYDLAFKVPMGYQVLAGGIESEQRVVGLGWQYFGSTRGRQRSLPIVITSQHVVAQLQGEITISSYFLSSHNRIGNLLPKLTARILRDYQEHYGPYPYKEIIIVEHSAAGVGMAADGMILLPTDVYKYQDLTIPGLYDRLVEGLLAHEIAHHYWGIGIGMDLEAENWLSEGFAEYLSISYFERCYGAEGNNLFDGRDPLLAELMRYYFGKQNYRERSEWGYLTSLQMGMDEAVVKPWPEVQYLNTTTNRIYQKGYLVLRALEDLVGLEQMEEILERSYSAYGQNPAMSVDDLQRIAQEVTGEDLEPFFQSWLYNDDGWVDYAVSSFETRQMERAWQTDVVVTRKGTNSQPVTVRARCEDGTIHDQRWDGLKTQETLTFRTHAKVVQVEVDPEKMLPDRDRLNNTKPRKVDWTPHNDLSLDSYVVRYYPGIVPMGSDSFELGFGLSGRVRNNLMMEFVQIYPQSIWGFRAPYRSLQFGYQPTRSFEIGGGYEEFLGAKQGVFQAKYSFWRPLDIGQNATMWHPTHNFSAAVAKGRTPEEGEESIWQLAYVRDDSPRFAMSNAFVLTGYDDGSRAGWWEGMKISRPGYNTILITSADYCASQGLKEKQGFGLNLNAFPQEVGHFRAGTNWELVFPLMLRQEGRFVYGTLFEDIEGKVYLEGAGVWNDPSQREQSYRVGAGAEVTFGFTTGDLSGGAYPIGLTIGLAKPIWSAAGTLPQGPNIYVGIGLRYFSNYLGL